MCVHLQTAAYIRFITAHFQITHLWRRISQPNHYLLCKQGPVTAQSFVKDRQLQQSEQLIPHGKVQE